MNVEREVIAAVLRDRDLTPINDAGVTPGYFLNREDRMVYQSILDHHTKYGQIPSMDEFHKNYPASAYKLPKVTDTISVYLDEIKADYEHSLVEKGLTDALSRFDSGDVEGTKQAFQATL